MSDDSDRLWEAINILQEKVERLASARAYDRDQLDNIVVKQQRDMADQWKYISDFTKELRK